MRTGSKIKNPSTTVHGESRELQLLLFNFLCNVNRAPYKWAAKKWVKRPDTPPYVVALAEDISTEASAYLSQHFSPSEERLSEHKWVARCVVTYGWLSANTCRVSVPTTAWYRTVTDVFGNAFGFAQLYFC